MEYKRITSNFKDLEKVLSLYESAFPADEREPLTLLVGTDFWKGDFYAFYKDGAFCGLAFLLVDDVNCYLFYLAVVENLRGQGIGSAIMKQVRELYPAQRLVLEMEELDPLSENYAQRLVRCRFYERNGMKLTDVHCPQTGVWYHVLSADNRPLITIPEYKKMWFTAAIKLGKSPDEALQLMHDVYGSWWES